MFSLRDEKAEISQNNDMFKKMSLPVADPAPAAPCYMQLVLPLHVKNDRQEQLGCALRACPEAENTILT